ACLPDSSATGLPRVMIVFPRLAAGIARLGNGVEAPQLLAVLDVERRDPASRACVAGAVLDDDLPIGDERRRQEFLDAAEFVLAGNLLVPNDLAVVAVDRDDAAVGQIRDDLVFPERNAARPRCVALVLYTGIAYPHELCVVGIARVDLVDRAPAVRGVHVAV